jgi:hypothetical protein
MKRASIFTLFVVFLAMAIPCFGQQPFNFSSPNGKDRGCDLTGTWYGGSNMAVPYQFTAEPIDGTRYTVRFQQAFPLAAVGILGWTDWTGEIIKAKGPGHRYDVYAVSLYFLSPDYFDPSLSPDMDVIHSIIEFSPDCNTIRHTIDTYYGYMPWTEDKVPFVTEPDDNYLKDLGIETLVERYHRMPTACPSCPFSGTASSVLGPDSSILRAKKR